LPPATKHGGSENRGGDGADVRLVLLTNFVPPYRIPVFRELQRRVKQFRVLISTGMEKDRPWIADTGGLDVVTQSSLAVKRKWNQPRGFSESIYIHFPYDTLFRLARYRPDVIISGEFGFRTLTAALYRLLFRRCRLIVWATLSEETERYRSRLRIALRSTLVRFVDAIFTNGRSGIRYLERFRIERERLFIVPQTTDVAAFAAASGPREGAALYRMLYSGRLIARKQLPAFVEVLKSWSMDHPTRQIEMWFVGDGPELEILKKITVVPNLTLKFLGSLGYEELPAIYAQCGALVLPTLADEWALVVNEGLASGMPVLGSLYSQAVQDLVVDGDNGWVYRIDHIEEVKSAVARFLAADEVTLTAMQARARVSVSHLTPQFVAERILEVIAFATSERPA
jgi:glycosyltransferase involved in cell wall biosynthesis